LSGLRARLWGDPARQRLDEARKPGISSRISQVAYGHWGTRQAPTETFKQNLEIASQDLKTFRRDLKAFLQALEAYEAKLEAAGAPYTRGRKW
jgi:hypothetical protein